MACSRRDCKQLQVLRLFHFVPHFVAAVLLLSSFARVVSEMATTPKSMGKSGSGADLPADNKLIRSGSFPVMENVPMSGYPANAVERRPVYTGQCAVRARALSRWRPCSASEGCPDCNVALLSRAVRVAGISSLVVAFESGTVFFCHHNCVRLCRRRGPRSDGQEEPGGPVADADGPHPAGPPFHPEQVRPARSVHAGSNPLQLG